MLSRASAYIRSVLHAMAPRGKVIEAWEGRNWRVNKEFTCSSNCKIFNPVLAACRRVMLGRQMAAMSKGPALSSAVALENLVAYLETLPDKPSTPTVVGDVARGENLYAACVSCHGEMAQGLETMAAPKLAGQNDWYLVGQLQNFATGKRGYAPSDHSGRQMRAMMATLRGQSDYRDVVAYINTLPP